MSAYHRSVPHVHHPSPGLWCQLQRNAPYRAEARVPEAKRTNNNTVLHQACLHQLPEVTASLHPGVGLSSRDSPCTGGSQAPLSPGVCRSPWSGHSPSCSGRRLWRFSTTQTSPSDPSQHKRASRIWTWLHLIHTHVEHTGLNEWESPSTWDLTGSDHVTLKFNKCVYLKCVSWRVS